MEPLAHRRVYRPASGASPLWPALLLLAFVLLVGIYANLVPVFEGPDSGAHFRYIAYLRQRGTLPSLDTQTGAISHELIQQPPLYYALAALLTPTSQIEPALRLEVVDPYYSMGLSKRATVTLPGAPAVPALWIARLVSALGGLLAVFGTWGLVRELLPTAPWAALAGASVLAFNPQFLFSSASITNDTWAAATAVLTMWFALHLARHKECRMVTWLGLGATAGLAALAKTSNLAILLPVAIVIAPALWRLRWRRGALLGLFFVVGFLITAGFWYGRTQFRYGTVIPLGPMLAALPGLARDQAATAADIWRQVQWLPRSYWGVFGYGVLAQPWYYRATAWAMILGGVGLVAYLVRTRGKSDAVNGATIFVLIVWFGVVLGSLVGWMRIILYADQGRLLFPAAPAVATLLLLGWQGLCPRSLWSWLYRTVIVFFLVMAVSQIATLRDGYRMPEAIAGILHMDRPMAADFEAGMSLLGIDMPAGARLAANQPMPITLYFRARNEIPGFYTLFIHLADSENNMIWQFDGVPVRGQHPTRQWLPGQVFADSYIISARNVPEDGLATLSAGFYDARNPSERQRLINAPELTDCVDLAQVRLHSEPDVEKTSSPSPLATWSNGIQLAEVKIDKDEAGSPRLIALRWHALSPIHDNYTVSVQILDEQGKLLAQQDQAPQAGRYPTSTWRTGDSIEDRYTFEQSFTGWRHLIVLLYEQSGKRLLLSSPGVTANHFELASR